MGHLSAKSGHLLFQGDHLESSCCACCDCPDPTPTSVLATFTNITLCTCFPGRGGLNSASWGAGTNLNQTVSLVKVTNSPVWGPSKCIWAASLAGSCITYTDVPPLLVPCLSNPVTWTDIVATLFRTSGQWLMNIRAVNTALTAGDILPFVGSVSTTDCLPAFTINNSLTLACVGGGGGSPAQGGSVSCTPVP